MAQAGIHVLVEMGACRWARSRDARLGSFGGIRKSRRGGHDMIDLPSPSAPSTAVGFASWAKLITCTTADLTRKGEPRGSGIVGRLAGMGALQ